MVSAVVAIGGAVIASRATKKASKTQAKSVQRGQQILADTRAQARQDVLGLFPEAQQAQTRGFEQARQFLGGQVFPQQARLFQQGNVAAQETLAAGLPQFQSAILGQPTDLSGFQAKRLNRPNFNLSGFALSPNIAGPIQPPRGAAPNLQLPANFDFSTGFRGGFDQRRFSSGGRF